MTIVAGHFGPVDRRTVSQEVRDRLFEAIRSGALRPGAALPSERSLCDDFGVARTSVREAIQGLVSLGLLERRSNRTYVAELLPDLPVSAADNRKVKVSELFEVREAIEVPMVRLTAARASDRQRAEIAELAGRFSPRMAVEDFRRQDYEFHSKLAAACGNDLLAELYGKVLDRLFHANEFSSLLTATVNRRAVRQIIRDSVASHQAIADAVMRRSAADVTASVEAHLAQVESQLNAELI
ncbi:MAG TPA: FCD domain-containing protein [Candidatus Dormibacteraeota bacterium]|jgi:GntR family transcriptional repressor for pyruvate dehydrogenase complex|nr:FCD domain-containing protein [Candidatus Dormibacteraeota bacterium]